MDQNSVSFKQGIPFYMGIASIATGLVLLSVYSVSSWYNMLTAIIAFIAAGLILYLGWLTHMGMDTKDSDNGNGGGGRIFLDKPT
jgi:threonine/homoserine/homoserine lactone efflux protein